MPNLIQRCEEYFGVSNLYDVLGIQANANVKALKKAYYKTSLRVHPDRAQENNQPNATQRFQTLGQVYSILSDREKRAVYDETGVCDDDGFEQERDWTAYWKLHFKKVTVEEIEKFKKKYQGSSEEMADLIFYYEKYEGDMDKIMQCIPCGEIDEEPRFREIYSHLIGDGRLANYPAFTSETQKKREKRKKKFSKEAAQAETLRKKLGLEKQSTEEMSLAVMIRRNQQVREHNAENFFAHLEEKYCKQKVSNRKAGKEKSPVKVNGSSVDRKLANSKSAGQSQETKRPSTRSAKAK